MPNMVFDPERLPTKQEATVIAIHMRRNVQFDPDGSESDYLIIHLLEAYAKGEVK